MKSSRKCTHKCGFT